METPILYKAEPSPPKARGHLLRRLFVLLLFLLFSAGMFFLTVRLLLPLSRYNAAERLAADGKLRAAAAAFLALESFSDAAERADGCYLTLGLDALRRKSAGGAIAYYRMLSSKDGDASRAFQDALYRFAEETVDTGDHAGAERILKQVLPHCRDADSLLSGLYFRLGGDADGAGDFLSAYGYYLRADPSLVPAVSGALESLQSRYYDLAAAEYAETGRVPEAFLHEMLNQYRDSENFRMLRQLQQSLWMPEDYEENLRLVYLLGDFEGVQEDGFSLQRLYLRRFSNPGGAYLEMPEDGSIRSNLPHYRLSGYYGLYSKVEDGVYYIGADEARWTRQYGFAFSDNDQTLTVYCYAGGASYTLYAE